MKLLLQGLLPLLAVIPVLACAQDYPARTVTLVVPFPAGGSNDMVARYLSDSLSRLWKQTVIVENRPGGGSSVGTAFVAKSPPDGYRVVLVSASYTTNAATRTDQPFDPVKDLVPVSMVARGHNAIVTGSRVPMASLADLVREAKAKPIFYGTAGVGSAQHFNAELLNEAMAIHMESVPYKGGQEAMLDLVGGRIDVVVGALGGLLPHITAGKAKAIAVMSRERSPALPHVPTAIEAGFPRAVVDNYWALFVPAGTPGAVIQKLNQSVKTVTQSPEGRAFLAKVDGEPSQLSPDEVAAHVKKEIDHWTALSRKLNLSLK